ncbi:hypothetical protein Cpin_4834 [Chitinophaga pinensis DSM 2588]|uniref:Uncharacterized protein n=1 Tax=Chitinophaga pinensis (strain ATCC 43595 / DSM 2588 / LMG 13176 / NBRC 15968 / NCIMB 11800 / UQM 2034) TaxID=485918 RepID=A0A979GTR9_CHIPD|nr:hypothetical protein Cpin_4834 [Chitinophaga pinensis DSM 2588]
MLIHYSRLVSYILIQGRFIIFRQLERELLMMLIGPEAGVYYLEFSSSISLISKIGGPKTTFA